MILVILQFKKNHFHIWFTPKFREIFLWIDQHFSYIENLKENTLMDMIWILVSYKYVFNGFKIEKSAMETGHCHAISKGRNGVVIEGSCLCGSIY